MAEVHRKEPGVKFSINKFKRFGRFTEIIQQKPQTGTIEKENARTVWVRWNGYNALTQVDKKRIRLI